jgi:hypothetical protein
LISKCFAGHPENLWITLLKTRHQGRESLKNQGFCWIAHQMGIEKYFNKINDLDHTRGGLFDMGVVKFPKVEEPNFVHKSRGQADFF